MYSLKKHYAKDGELPLNTKDCIVTPKLDGAAIDITYINGKLSHALTRGDGIKGRDITSKMKYLEVPSSICLSSAEPIMMITGEVVAHKDVENSRNYASGALNLKDDKEFEERVETGSMAFIAYGVQYKTDEVGLADKYETDMKLLEDFCFDTVVDPFVPWEDIYPTDGIVYRINDNKTFNSMGWTDKFPRGAIAFKEEQEAVQTTLLDVVWQTGKSGKVTPVALLEPVMIGDAEVSRATLNNIAYIEALDLEIGCTVDVIRSGEIIPCIVGRVYD
jgi:DNA ligase (NAD+)